MAASADEVTKIRDACVDIATKLKQAKAIIDQALAFNSAVGTQWDEAQAGDVVELHASLFETLDGDNVFQGTGITPAEVSNVIGSAANFQTWWATHGGNMEKLAKPIV